MSNPTRPGGSEAESLLSEQMSSLKGLLALSMRMTDSADENEILSMAGTAVPSLARCRLVGAHLGHDGWRLTPDEAADAQLRADIEAQFAVVSAAGGAIAVGHEKWGWAYPLRSAGGDFGFLVVSGGAEPSPAEQFLLRVLAQQIGIALASARLHAQQRRYAAELLDTNSRLAETVARLERSTAVHDRLNRVAVAGEGQEGIARALHELTGFVVAIEDRYGNLRAWAGPDRPDPYPKEPRDLRDELVRRALTASGPIRHHGQLLVAAHPHDDVVGVVALIDPDEVAGEEVRRALEHGATVLAMELARLSGIADTEVRLRRDLVDDLVAGTDTESAVARADALGYDLERPHRVVVVECSQDTRERDEFFHAVRRAARDCGVGTLIGVRAKSVMVLADTDRPWETFRLAVEQQLRGGRCRVGVGSLCHRVSELPESRREAVTALRVQTVSGGDDQATVFEELGVYRLLAGVGDLRAVDRFVRHWLGDLLDYDSHKEASELVITLGKYLDSGGRYEATAQALHVHRSTLKYRLQRVREISAHDLRSPDVQFNLQLAVRAWRTLQALRGEML
jgi:DNA-binding PucR family transcriptional regulator